jgi:signal peptidase II
VDSILAPTKKTFIWPLALIVLLVIIDQVIKIYIKTQFHLGDSINVFGEWFQLYFVENNGAAFGLELGGNIGKYILTGFRLVVTVFGFIYLFNVIRKGANKLLLIALALILAGAIGNIIDSVFYGVIFNDINLYQGSWFQGQVVDMFYAPMIEGVFPNWLPFWGGDSFTFFSPIWNFADACISIGVFSIILGQRVLFAESHLESEPDIQSEIEEIIKES